MRKIGNWFGLQSVAEHADVVVLGCPFDGAASGRLGAAGAPPALRKWSRSSEAITEDGRTLGGLRIADLGDLPNAASWHADTRGAARRALAGNPGSFLLGLGGDHAVTQPLLQAVGEVHPGIGLLFLDAHADLFDEYAGDRRSHACTVARAWDEAGVDPQATALVGLRSFARPELPALAQAGLAITAREWLSDGPEAVANRIAEVLGGRPVYLSLDIDVLDPSCAPGTGYPVAGGPTTRDLLDLLARLWPATDIVAMDLVEVAPALDPTEIAVSGAAHVLLQILGHVEEARAGRVATAGEQTVPE